MNDSLIDLGLGEVLYVNTPAGPRKLTALKESLHVEVVKSTLEGEVKTWHDINRAFLPETAGLIDRLLTELKKTERLVTGAVSANKRLLDRNVALSQENKRFGAKVLQLTNSLLLDNEGYRPTDERPPGG